MHCPVHGYDRSGCKPSDSYGQQWIGCTSNYNGVNFNRTADMCLMNMTSTTGAKALACQCDCTTDAQKAACPWKSTTLYESNTAGIKMYDVKNFTDDLLKAAKKLSDAVTTAFKNAQVPEIIYTLKFNMSGANAMPLSAFAMYQVWGCYVGGVGRFSECVGLSVGG